MENKEVSELVLPEIKERKGFLVYAKIVFLPILVYACALLAYFHYIAFKIVLMDLVLMGLILCVALIFARHNGEYASNILEQQKDDFKQALKRFIMKNFLSIGRETKCNSSFDDFANSYIKNARNESFASIAPACFVLMGILGTFISIALSLPNFKVDDISALESEISALLNSVGTSFYVSIYGIFLALWWSFFEKFGTSKMNALIERQKNATSSFFWSKEEIEQRYISAGIKHFEKIGLVFEQVSNEDFFKELDTAIERKFGLFQEMLGVEERAIKVSSEHIKQTMSELQRAHRNQKDLGKIYLEMTNAVAALNQNLKETSARMSEQYNRLIDISNEKTIHLDKTLVSLEEKIDNFKRSFEYYQNAMLENSERAFSGFKIALMQGMREFKEVYEEEKNIDDNIEMMNQLKSEISELDDETNKLMEKMNTELKKDQKEA